MLMSLQGGRAVDGSKKELTGNSQINGIVVEVDMHNR